MSSRLEEILARTQLELDKRMVETSESELQARARDRAPAKDFLDR